jgi:excisionase family DNA binding protein
MTDIVETMTVTEVAKRLNTSPMKIKHAILNGTMPIGMVARENDHFGRYIATFVAYKGE